MLCVIKALDLRYFINNSILITKTKMSRWQKSLNYSRNRIYFVQSCINRSFVYLQLRLSSYRCNLRTILNSSVNEARNSLTLSRFRSQDRAIESKRIFTLCVSIVSIFFFFFLEFNEKEKCLFLSLSLTLSPDSCV